MSERDDYPAGVPCWVENLQPDPTATIGFYRSLFGWNFIEAGRKSTDEYYIAQLRGRDVAGIGSFDAGLGPVRPGWTTHVRVASANEATGIARKAGGRVLIEPFDVLPAGRMAVLADPAGATFAVWEAGYRPGARLVNEAGAWALSTLGTPDPHAAEDFYCALFGWTSQPFGNTPLQLFRLAGYFGGHPTQPVPRDVVAVMRPLTRPDDLAQWAIDFWIDDVDAAAARAAEHGGVVKVTPRDSGGFRYTVVADPQGATFTVSKRIEGS